MSVGKRHSTAEPLTEHDMADRLSKAMLRVWRILLLCENEGIREEVRTSRFLVVMPSQLIEALEAFAAPAPPEPEPKIQTGPQIFWPPALE